MRSQPEIASWWHGRGSDTIVNGLTARWRMDEDTDGQTATGLGGEIIDISPNGNHATGGNSPTYRAAPMKLHRAAG